MKQNFTFREATESDYPAIISFHKAENWGLDTVTALKNFQQNGNQILLCEKEGRIIGKMDLLPKKRAGREFLYVERVFIHPDYRRQGIAKQFLAYAEEECKKRGLLFLELAVREENVPARKLYENTGFKELGKKIYLQKEIK